MTKEEAMEFRLKGGVAVDESYFEKLSELAAAGDYPGEPGEWAVRQQGRPRACGEELVSVTFKVPKSQRDAMDRRAKSLNETRSEYLRRLSAEDAFAAVG